jgi:hypothetical protein
MAVSQFRMNLDQTGRKREALHMLILSGVLRPSHIGLRYMPLPSAAEEETPGSLSSPSVPAQVLHHLRRVFTMLCRWKTQLLSREPQYVEINTVRLGRAAAPRMCLRS